MLGNALGAGHDVIVTPESQFASELISGLDTGTIAPSRDEISEFVKNHWRFSIWDLPFPDISWAGAENSPYDFASTLLKTIVKAYAMQHGKPEATVWVDQTPEHIAQLHNIHKTSFEHCAVHLVRDGRAIAASLKKVDWGPTNAQDMASWWSLRLSEAFASQVAGNIPTEMVRYEDIIRDPASSLANLCKSLPLKYDNAMISSKALAVPKYTQTQHTSVGKGIQSARTEAWRNELSDREIEIFENVAGNLLRVLDYPLQYRSPRPASYIERAWSGFVQHPLRRRKQRRVRNRRFAESRNPS